jgi:hypothetical protein
MYEQNEKRREIWQKSKILSTRYASIKIFFLLPTTLFWLDVQGNLCFEYVSICPAFLFFFYCNMTTNQINAFMREKKREREDVRARQTNTIDFFFSFLFGVKYAIGLVDGLNMHFCPMICENDVI